MKGSDGRTRSAPTIATRRAVHPASGRSSRASQDAIEETVAACPRRRPAGFVVLRKERPVSFPIARKRTEKPEPPPKAIVGTDVDTRCRKCKATTKHVVIAKVGAKPTRVRCGTCELEHEYTATRPRRTADAAPRLLSWAEAIAQARSASAPYLADTSYRVGARVSHATFGEGVVVRLASLTACEVLFESRTVKLVMRSAASGFDAPPPPTSVAPRHDRRLG